MTEHILLRVVVSLPGALESSFERARRPFQAYVVRLISQLELPLDPQFERGPATDGHLELTLGTRVIALPERGVHDEISLTEILTHAVFSGRVLLVTEDLVDALRRRWLIQSPSTPEDPAVRDGLAHLLRSAVHYGLRAGRFASAVSDPSIRLDARTVAELVETHLDVAENVVEIRAGTVQHAAISSPEPSADGPPEKLVNISDELFYELGIVYRLGRIAVDPMLEPGLFQFEWNDVSAPPVTGIAAGEFLVNDTADRLTLLNLVGKPAINPVNNAECARLTGDAARATCEQAGLTIWGPREYLALHLGSQIRRNAGSLLSRRLVELYLMRLEETLPALIAEVRRRFSLSFLATALRALVDEGIGVRNLRGVLESFVAVTGTTSANFSKLIVFVPNTDALYPSPTPRTPSELMPEEYAECARTALKRYISHKYTRGSNTLVVYLLSQQIETLLAGSSRERLSSEDERTITSAIWNEIGELTNQTQAPVILTTADVRRALVGLIQPVHPGLAVLSYQELSPDLNIQPLARVELPRSVSAR